MRMHIDPQIFLMTQLDWILGHGPRMRMKNSKG